MNLKCHIVRIDGSKILNWDDFHDAFKDVMGFPDFYGRNSNAWIDCMGDIHHDTKMLNVTLSNDTALVLEVTDAGHMEEKAPDILEGLASLVAFVNKERIQLDSKDAAPIHLVLYS